MIIKSEDCKATLELVSCGAEWEACPSVCFTAAVSSPEVTGCVQHAWCAVADVERFIADLRALHAGTVSSARLESLSPEEFVCEAFPLNSVGHVGIRFVLSGMRHAESTVFPFKLSAGFQVDPTLLPVAADALAAEFVKQKPSS